MTDTPTPWDPGSGEPVPPTDPARPTHPAPPPGTPGFAPPGSMPPPGAYPPPDAYPQAPYQQPPHQQPPNQQPGQSPPERTKRKLWPWLLGAFAVLTLGIGGCSFVAYRAFKGPIDQANEFLAAVDAGDYAGAASMASTDPRCFGETAERDLATFFGPVDIADYDLTSVNVSTGGGDSVSDVSGTITISGSSSTSINVNLLKVDGDWEICGVQVDP